MPITEHEKLGVHARPFSDSLAGVPFKKRKLFFTRSPSPPPQLPPSLPEDCDVQCKPESSESDSPLSQACNRPVIVNANDVNESAVTGKEVHSESEEEVINRGMNVSQKLDTLLVPSDPGSGQYAADFIDVINTEQEMVLDNKVLPLMGSMQLLSEIQETLEVPRNAGSEDGQIFQGEGISFLNNKILPGTGSMISEGPPSTMQETLEVPPKVESDEGNIVPSDEISGKQDNMEHKALLMEPSEAKLKVDSGHHSLSRSNWDLNTMMDSWEGSKAKFTLDHGTSTNGRLELVDMQEERLDLCLDQSLHKETSKADVMLGNCNVQTDDQDHKLLNQSVVMAEHSNFEACLDLQLKPSFLADTCTTSSNLNLLREMPSLSLSASPTNMVCSEDLQLATNRAVKNEPYESGHGDTRIVDEMGGTNSLVLKPVKSELREAHETSKTTAFSDLKSDCSIAVKPETLDQSEGVKSSEERLISFELEGRRLSLQSTEIDQRACKFDGNLPVSTCKSSEPYESGHGDTRIVDEMGGPNSVVLKPVKSEPCEAHETSKITAFSDLKSACSIAVKPETLNQSEGVKRCEERLTSFELEGHHLSLQSTEIDQRACKFDGNLPVSTCKSSERYESGHRDTRIVDEMGCPNSLVLKPVTSEPCEAHETSKTTAFSDLKSSCSIAVKRETLNQSEGVKSSEERLISFELEGHRLSPQGTEIDQRACKFDGNLPDSTCESSESKSLERRPFQKDLGGHGLQRTEMHQKAGKFEGNKSVITCKSPGLDERRLHSTAEDPSAHISEISSNILDQSQDAGIQPPSPCVDLAPDAVMHDAAKETATMPSGMGTRLMNSDANDFTPSLDKRMLHSDAEDPSAHTSNSSDNIVDNAHDADIHPPTPSDGLAPDTVMPNAAKETDMTTMISGVNELNSKDKKCKTDNLPSLSETLAFDCKELTAVDGPSESVAPVDSSDDYNSESTQIDELTGQCEGSKVGESDEFKDKIDISPATLDKPCEIESKADASYDAYGAINALPKQHGADNEDYKDGEVLGLALISAVEERCNEREEEKVKDIDSVNSADVPVLKSALVEEKEISVHNPSELKSSPCDNKDGHGSSSIGWLIVNPAKTRPIKIVHKMSKDCIKKNEDPDVGLSSNTVRKGHKGDVSNQYKKAEGSQLCKKEPSQTDDAPKDVTGTGQPSRIIYLNSSNRLASEKLKFESGSLSSSQIDRESHLDCSFNRDRYQSRGSRNEPSSEKSRKIEVTDFVRNRRRTDDRNTDSRRVLEHNNSSTGIRFSRRLNDSEMFGTAASIAPSRKKMNQENDELRNISRVPQFKGLSPGMGCHPIQETSLSSRFIGREMLDFGLAHEENLRRNLPDSQPHAESYLVHRGRTSLSPTRRRSDALRLPVDCSESSSRARRRSPPQWTASRRCPEAYTGPPELVRCRSPQMIRLDRMRSPHRHPYYQEEMVVRRCASPPYGRLSDDAIDRGHNFQRSVRGSNRNMRMFNVIDHREAAEEDYFRPPLHQGQICEFSEDDDYVDDRRVCEERRGPVRSFRQHFVPNDGDDDDDSFRFRVEEGPSRPFRLCPENNNEGFPTRGSLRGFDGRFRNRLCSASGRFVGIEQEQDENYRHHEAQGWGDDGYTDVRMKRRRF